MILLGVVILRRPAGGTIPRRAGIRGHGDTSDSTLKTAALSMAPSSHDLLEEVNDRKRGRIDQEPV
jgi:hypothetical protein